MPLLAHTVRNKDLRRIHLIWPKFSEKLRSLLSRGLWQNNRIFFGTKISLALLHLNGCSRPRSGVHTQSLCVLSPLRGEVGFLVDVMTITIFWNSPCESKVLLNVIGSIDEFLASTSVRPKWYQFWYYFAKCVDCRK